MVSPTSYLLESKIANKFLKEKVIKMIEFKKEQMFCVKTYKGP